MGKSVHINNMSKLEATLALHIKGLKLPPPKTEYKFHPTRRWRFDFAWSEQKLAGGGWINGRHNRGTGFANDMEKYHEAMKLGWNIYRCNGELMNSGRAIEVIELLLSSTTNARQSETKPQDTERTNRGHGRTRTN